VSPRSLCRVIGLVLLLLASGAVCATAQGLEYVKANYTKHEYSIPMRDGVHLFTAVYAPKDQSQKYPILLRRTPYSIGPYGADRYPGDIGPSELVAKEGYIFAYQDVRGCWMSEGEFANMRPILSGHGSPKEIDESTDTYDTIDWLIKHLPNHNGRVGQWGISYPGFYTVAGLIDAHPALKAASPQAPVTDWFATDDFHHNGTLFLAHAFSFFSGFGQPRPGPTSDYWGRPFNFSPTDSYEFFLRLGSLRNADERYFKGKIPFWNDLMAHETKDAFWQARNIRPHLKNIKPAVMTVGGWYDAENLFGALETYRTIEANSPSSSNLLVMGPWVHGGWARMKGDSLGDVRFDANTSEYFREKIELPFFNYHLKGKGAADLPKASVFETGTNQWRRLDAWPPRRTVTRSLYFHPNGKLSFDPPTGDEKNAFDEYVSDPAKPVPCIPGTAGGMPQRYMVDDQRFAARRPDVLVYQTDALQEDVTIAGPLRPRLHVSTTGTDCDWVVKLIDVYPDRFPDEKGDANNTLGAYQQMVRGDILRGKFRGSFEKPEPFTPGKPTLVEFSIPDIFHTFRSGHRIMVQVQSSWFPLANLNPQKFMNINQSTEADFRKATQRLYHSKSLPSQVIVGVLPSP
jgi:putative CocE/NonD family hydrolase